MIELLAIDGIPCFGTNASPLYPLKQVTFLYGPNGSGKSSIAKSLQATQDNGLTPELFDKDFVEQLLRPDQRMPGVFVIRDNDPLVQKRIDQLVGSGPSGGQRQGGEIEQAEKVMDQFSKSISRQEELVSDATDTLTDSSWVKRKALPEPFKQSFRGFLGDSSKNLNEILKVRAETSAHDTKTKDELLETYEQLGDESTQELQRVQAVPSLGDTNAEQIVLLEQPIKSKDETSFGDFTRLLGNSDWVRQGLRYLEKSIEQCPFCQQTLSQDIADSLNSLFDHIYEDEIKAVRETLTREELRHEQIGDFLSTVRAISVDEAPEIENATEALQQRIAARKQQIEAKIEAPSSSVVLLGFTELESELKKLVSSANERIDGINQLLRNRKNSIRAVNQEVWRYYVHSVLGSDLSTYDGAIAAPTKALESLGPKFNDAKEALQTKRDELNGLQQELTSAAPTVSDINRTLLNLGFLSFSIKHRADDDTYQLVRSDGAPASHSLSEGERTLISFLYFYHKLMRLQEDRSVSGAVVAIIDDPVSSLDGEMLFVINLLLRKIFEACVKKTGRLEQVILLTHNAFFFKESEFTPRGASPGDRSYFVLAKGTNGTTTYKHYEKSPIRSNYAQLWNQVRAASKAENPELSAWLPNAMRRIIENYFQIAGGLDTEQVLAEIPESDRWACQALLAWYNDGSHTAPWDVDYSSISSDASTHVRAFRQVFDASGHSAHYKMMMEE